MSNQLLVLADARPERNVARPTTIHTSSRLLELGPTSHPTAAAIPRRYGRHKTDQEGEIADAGPRQQAVPGGSGGRVRCGCGDTPSPVAVDTAGNVYTADTATKRVLNLPPQ